MKIKVLAAFMLLLSVFAVPSANAWGGYGGYHHGGGYPGGWGGGRPGFYRQSGFFNFGGGGYGGGYGGGFPGGFGGYGGRYGGCGWHHHHHFY